MPCNAGQVARPCCAQRRNIEIKQGFYDAVRVLCLLERCERAPCELGTCRHLSHAQLAERHPDDEIAILGLMPMPSGKDLVRLPIPFETMGKVDATQSDEVGTLENLVWSGEKPFECLAVLVVQESRVGLEKTLIVGQDCHRPLEVGAGQPVVLPALMNLCEHPQRPTILATKGKGFARESRGLSERRAADREAGLGLQPKELGRSARSEQLARLGKRASRGCAVPLPIKLLHTELRPEVGTLGSLF